MLQRLAVVVAALVPFASSGADQPSGPAPPSCSGESHRQFDFWLGEWTVTQNGKPAGESRIERVLDGCALLEHWSGTSGYTGKSLNLYDRSRGVWHQTWIDHRGSPLYLEGSFANGRMTLTGVQTDPETKATVRHRIVWTALPSGEVRQQWDASRDGTTWEVQFDGLYTPRR